MAVNVGTEFPVKLPMRKAPLGGLLVGSDEFHQDGSAEFTAGIGVDTEKYFKDSPFALSEKPELVWDTKCGLGVKAYAGWGAVTGRASLRWIPAGLWRLTMDLGREVVETPEAIDHRITADTVALGAEVRLPPRWTLAAAISGLAFSDGNDRRRISGRVDYAVKLGQPRVVIGVDGAAFNDSLPASFAGMSYRATDGTVMCCVEGRGSITFGQETFTFEPGDVMAAPPWVSYRLAAETECIIFSYSDRAAQVALGFWREERIA